MKQLVYLVRVFSIAWISLCSLRLFLVPPTMNMEQSLLLFSSLQSHNHLSPFDFSSFDFPYSKETKLFQEEVRLSSFQMMWSGLCPVNSHLPWMGCCKLNTALQPMLRIPRAYNIWFTYLSNTSTSMWPISTWA